MRRRRTAGSLAVTFRKRATAGVQSGRGFVPPHAWDQVPEVANREFFTWLVINGDDT